MNELLSRIARAQKEQVSVHADLYQHLAANGQSPKVLMISCADSRVVPEFITQALPGDLFVCRNAGNIVPPFSQANGGVSSAVEYAVEGLGVTDIVVCGHSDCGAMKAFLSPETLARMPNVAAWLRHAHAAHSVVCSAYPHMDDKARVRALAQENVVVQLNHLRTHPSVAAGLAQGRLSLHGWFFEIETAKVLALDGRSGRFAEISEDGLQVAISPERRLAGDQQMMLAAE